MIMCKDIKRMEHTVNVSHFWFIGVAEWNNVCMQPKH